MSIEVTIGNNTYEVPQQNEAAGYGEELTDFLVDIAGVLGSVSGPNDIATTTDTIVNGQTSAAGDAVEISGLSFSTAAVRSFVVDYVVFRTANSVTVMESGQLKGTYDGVSEWYFTDEKLGDAGMFFQINASGQIEYYSSDMLDDTIAHAGVIKFKASTLDI